MSEIWPLDLAVGLVDHDLRVRQGEPPPLGAAGQQDRGARGGHADAVGRDRAVDELHRVVDGQRAVDAAAGAVDVEADPLRLVLELEVEELHDRHVRRGVVDHAFEEDDPVFQQHVAQRHLPLAGHVAVALEPRRVERMFVSSSVGPWGRRPDRRGRRRRAGPGRGRRQSREGSVADPSTRAEAAEGASASTRRRGSSGSAVASRLLRGRAGGLVERLDRLSSTSGTSSSLTNSRIRSIVFRSRICEAIASARPSFSTRARTRRGVSSVRAAIASISTSMSSSSTLMSSASAIFARTKNSLRLCRVDSWALARSLGLAGPDVGVVQAALAEFEARRRRVDFSCLETRSAGRSNGVSAMSWSSISRRTAWRFWNSSRRSRTPLRPSRRSARSSKPVPLRNGVVELGQAERLQVEDVEGDLDRLAPEARVGRG